MARIPSRKRKARAEFYEAAFNEADRADLAAAREVQGIDDEIALLRLQLRRTLEDSPVDHKLLLAGVRLLLQALLVQHRLSPAQADDLLEFATGIAEGVRDAIQGALDA